MKLPYKLTVLLHKLQAAGCAPIRREGSEFRCRCPAHADHGPSLYVRPTEDRILIHCGAGCSCEAVCDRLDHAMSDLSFAPGEPEVEVDADLNLVEAGGGREPSVPPPPPTAAVPDTMPAGEDLRHAVYGGLLAPLELSTPHFEALRQRGLAAADITQRGYKTADACRVRSA